MDDCYIFRFKIKLTRGSMCIIIVFVCNVGRRILSRRTWAYWIYLYNIERQTLLWKWSAKKKPRAKEIKNALTIYIYIEVVYGLRAVLTIIFSNALSIYMDI